MQGNRGDEVQLIPDIKVSTPFTFMAKLISVIDGDTIVVEVDLGFYMKVDIKMRLLGLNTPPPIDKPGGVLAKEFVEKELTNCQLVVETKKKGKYGRYLGYIYYHPKHSEFLEIVRRGKIINEELLNQKLAKEYK